MAQIAILAVLEGRPEDAEELLERCVAACDVDAAPGEHWRDSAETAIGLPAVVDFAALLMGPARLVTLIGSGDRQDPARRGGRAPVA
jgi:hypothetical protein